MHHRQPHPLLLPPRCLALLLVRILCGKQEPPPAPQQASEGRLL